MGIKIPGSIYNTNLYKPSRPWDITITSLCTLIVVSVQTKLDPPPHTKKKEIIVIKSNLSKEFPS